MKYIHKERIVKKSKPIDLPEGCIGVTITRLYNLKTGKLSEKIKVEYLEPYDEFAGRDLWAEAEVEKMKD